MLAKKHRLNSVQFNAVFKGGKKKHGKDFMIIYVTSDETRLAVTISKKKAKKAVERVRVRRQIYEYIRKNLLQNMSGSYIVMAKEKEFDLSELDSLLT